MSSSQDPSASSGQASPNIEVGSTYTPRRPSPLVSISVNHPLATAARKIKNFLTHKQTLFSTTFNIKITPIVALVSFLGVAALFGGGITTAFNFGKSVEQRLLTSPISPTPVVSSTPQPSPLIISKSGTIKSTYQLPASQPHPTPLLTGEGNNMDGSSLSEVEGSTSGEPKNPSPFPTVSNTVLHYILVSRNGTINYLSTSPSIHLASYLNLRVLVTGSWDSAKNALTISKPEDIEVLQ